MSLTINLTRSLTRPLTRPITEFQATDFSGNVLWLDASDDTTIIKDGSNLVSQWDDKSGQGNNATQGTGVEQPVYGSNTINGRNVLTFDDTNSENMLISSFGSFMSGSDKVCTVFTVFKHRETASQYMWGFGRSTNDAPIYAAQISSSQTYKPQKRDDASSIKTPEGSTAITTGTAYIAAQVIDSTGTDVDVYINGTQDIAAGDIDVGTTTIDEFMVGGVPFASAPFLPWNGDIGEIIIYNRSLSTEEITQVNNYLSNKWGISI